MALQVLVTGANRGLGRELARQYAAGGAAVVGLCRDPVGVPEGIEPLVADLADSANIQQVAARLQGRPLDIVINNAAIRGATGGLGAVDPADFHAVMAVNVLAPLLIARALRANLGAGQGKFVLISSRAGSLSEGLDPDGDYAYRCSKAALNMAGVKLAYDFPELTVLMFHPGWVQTDMGGPDAELCTVGSARGLLAQIAAATPADSGSFRTWDGKPVAW